MLSIKNVKEIIAECEKVSGIKFDGDLSINSRLSKSLGRTLARINRINGKEIIKQVNIEISKSFIEVATKEELIEVVKHEFAHYVTFRTYGNHAHNTFEFVKICRKLGTSADKSMQVEGLKDKVKVKKYEVFCKCCGSKVASYTRNCDFIKSNGIGYQSSCCRADLRIVQNY